MALEIAFVVALTVATLFLTINMVARMADRPDTCLEDAKAKYYINTEEYINIGFAGHSKTGKSSLINSLRGLKNNDLFAAGTDTIEKTHRVEMFKFPHKELNVIRLWDVPGSGTVTHTTEGYYVKKGLCAFDVLVILVQDTIGTDEIELAKYSQKYNQPFIFVKAKMDIHLENALEDGGYEEENQESANHLISKTKTHIRNQLKQKGFNDVDLYVISNKTLRKVLKGHKVPFQFEEMDFVKGLFQKMARRLKDAEQVGETFKRLQQSRQQEFSFF